MRKAVRDMLYSLSADTLVEVSNGTEAINALSKNQFDIVLCDYNLGVGKNGQQVLEEARHRKLISYDCVFIIMSTEQTASMVLGAMDSKPDEYLTRPFNAQQLHTRLQRQLQRKTYLQTVMSQMQRGDWIQAIDNCDGLLAIGDKHMRSALLKLRAELALQVGDYEKAIEIYQQALTFRELNWARLGLGVVYYLQSHFDAALSTFEQLVSENPLYMEAYDWLTKTHEALNQLTDAQQVLTQAIQLSPQSILRQKKLAQTADKNGQFELAEAAYQAVVKLGKYSVHKSSSDFANLAKLYSKTNAIQQALNILDNMRQEFINNPEAELRAVTLETTLHKLQGEEDLAQQAWQRMLTLAQQFESKVPKDLQLDVVQSCYLFDQSAQGDSLLADLIKAHLDDEPFLDDIRQVQSLLGRSQQCEKLIRQLKRSLININNQGVALYKQGNFEDAIAVFESAIATMPDNKTIVLNMLKIMIHELKIVEITDDKIRRIELLLKRAQQIGVDMQLLNLLQVEFRKISQKVFL